MARNKSKGKSPAYMVFNVTYEDGSVTSNRRVSTDLLDQSFGDALEDLVSNAITSQDQEISLKSRQQRAKVKSIVAA